MYKASSAQYYKINNRDRAIVKYLRVTKKYF